jgi:hypothetical protein
LHGKWDFAGIIRLRILRSKDYAELFKWPNITMRICTRERQEYQMQRKGLEPQKRGWSKTLYRQRKRP